MTAAGGGRRRGCPWTAPEVRALKDGWEGHGPYWDGWAELLPGRTGASVAAMARMLGLPRDRRGERYTEAEDAAILRHVLAAPEEVGRSPSSVAARVSTLGARWRKDRAGRCR